MQYLALYRKYRPRRFGEVVGQEVITQTLQNAVAGGRTSHAYLFCGPRGTGKTSTAKILAAAVNCAAPVNGEPCGECASCQMMADSFSPDVFEFDAASNSRVEQMRDLLEKVSYPPTVGTRRVYILDEVHMLSQSAFNALLKTLEEPPSFAMFILATTEPQRLPATIISRCQRFDFKRLDQQVIAEHLHDVLEDAGAAFTDEAVQLIARLSEGGMRDALSLADQVAALGVSPAGEEDVIRVTGGVNTEFLSRISRLLIDGDLGNALELLNRALLDGGDPAMIAHDMARYFRDMLVCACVTDPGRFLRLDNSSISTLIQLANETSRQMLTQSLKILLALDGSMRYAQSPRVALETALSQIALGVSPDSADLSGIEHRLDQLEERVKNGVIPQTSSAPAPAPAWSVTEALAGELPVQRKKPAQKPQAEEDVSDDPQKAKSRVLDAVRREKISVYSVLEKAKYQLEGDQLILSFSKDEWIYSQLMAKKENRDLVERIASGVYNKSIHVAVKEYEKTYFDAEKATSQARAIFGDKLRIE
ncbi:MAG: DNA polymerase III subunit gamma/tau [Clostridia bacterium]|nr:DNA polymerase III subunit gamma/tau [Clostridia bacterium]